MVQCEYCGTDIVATLPFTCNECGGRFCPDHRLPESHWCEELRRSEKSWSTTTSENAASTDRSRPEPMDTSTIPTYRSGDDVEIGDPSPDVNPDGSIVGDESSTDPSASPYSWSLSLSRGRQRQVKQWGKRIVYLAVGTVLVIGLLVAFTPVQLTDYWQSSTAEDIDRFLNNSSEDVESVVSGVFEGPNNSSLPNTDTPTSDSTSDRTISGLSTSEIEQRVHDRINEIRLDRGLPPLDWGEGLHTHAQYHSEWMANQLRLEHSSLSQYPCRQATGENIAYTYADTNIRKADGSIVNYDENETRIAHGVANQWMNSPGHRRNILNTRWRSEGIGVAIVEIEGRLRVYVTQAFCG